MMRHEETSNCMGFCGSKSAVSRDEAFLLGSSFILVFVLRAHFSCVLFVFLVRIHFVDCPFLHDLGWASSHCCTIREGEKLVNRQLGELIN
jgi:hypothetical protein